MHTYDFGSNLIRNGEIVDYGDTWYKENLALRTVIGQKGHLEYVILVVDGVGSTTLYFNGEVLNNSSDIIERKISDILQIRLLANI